MRSQIVTSNSHAIADERLHVSVDDGLCSGYGIGDEEDFREITFNVSAC